MEVTTPPKLVVINSSLSTDSNSRILCRYAWKYAEKRGMDVILIDLKDYRVLPYGEEGSEGIEVIEGHLDGAEGIVLSFPLYNFNMNATLKALIEHCGACFDNKVVGIMAAAGGRASYMSLMSVAQSLMLDFRSWIVPRYVYALADDIGDETIDNQEICRRVEELVETTYRVAWQHRMPVPAGSASGIRV